MIPQWNNVFPLSCRGWFWDSGCLTWHSWQAHCFSSFCPWKTPGGLWRYLVLYTNQIKRKFCNILWMLTPFFSRLLEKLQILLTLTKVENWLNFWTSESRTIFEWHASISGLLFYQGIFMRLWWLIYKGYVTECFIIVYTLWTVLWLLAHQALSRVNSVIRLGYRWLHNHS